jgi:hypothetical protein
MTSLTITLSAVRAKQLELSQNPPRRQNGQPIRHLTRAMAEDEGFVIDTHCYPHYGYVMDHRFISSVENVHVYTDLEADLIAAAKDVTDHIEGGLPLRGWLRDTDKARAALAALKKLIQPK